MGGDKREKREMPPNNGAGRQFLRGLYGSFVHCKMAGTGLNQLPPKSAKTGPYHHPTAKT